MSRRQATSLASAGIVALGAAVGPPEPDGVAEVAATAIDDGTEFAVEVEQADRTLTAASAAARQANRVVPVRCVFTLSFTVRPPIVVLESVSIAATRANPPRLRWWHSRRLRHPTSGSGSSTARQLPIGGLSRSHGGRMTKCALVPSCPHVTDFRFPVHKRLLSPRDPPPARSENVTGCLIPRRRGPDLASRERSIAGRWEQ